jgi:excinuclease ABC subunit C
MLLTEKELEEYPRLPGVYVMRDELGRVIYVGKAKDLRARLRSYLRQGDSRLLVRYLLKELAEVEVIVTASEKEALILENNLIKKHRPRYNVRLRDDKDYVHIRIDTSHPFPRLSIARRPQKDGAVYFGPYASAHAARNTVRLIQRHMGLRTCKDLELKLAKRGCINYQMGRCAGVCSGKITREEYALRVQEAIMFLQGRSTELLRQLKERMKRASDELRFEEAARLRDQIREIEKTLEAQRVDKPLGKDRDVVAIHRVGMEATIAVMVVRGGKLSDVLTFQIPPTPLEDQEVLASFLQQFYERGRIPPPEILVSVPLGEEVDALEEWLREIAQAKVRIRRPLRGEARSLVEMAQENAKMARREATFWWESAAQLARRLGMVKEPRVIDAFDISSLGGKEAVGAAVRFVEGIAEPSMYRTYKIKTVEGQDDYSMLYEVIRRHLLRKKEEGSLPDLIMVDGGKGQLSVAIAALEDLGLEGIEAIALAKERTRGGESVGDRLFLRGKKEPIPVEKAGDALRVLLHLRDEAHRVAISRHRRRRTARKLASPLDLIPGIGPVRKKQLLRHLGSLDAIKEASLEELSQVPGISISLAKRIRSFFDSGWTGEAR